MKSDNKITIICEDDKEMMLILYFMEIINKYKKVKETYRNHRILDELEFRLREVFPVS